VWDNKSEIFPTYKNKGSPRAIKVKLGSHHKRKVEVIKVKTTGTRSPEQEFSSFPLTWYLLEFSGIFFATWLIISSAN